LDIDFDADDFFNQFDESKPKAPEPKKVEKPVEQKTTTAESEFVLLEKPKPNEEKSKPESPEDVSEKYEKLVKSGATQISSDMMFGTDGQQKQKSERWNSAQVMDSLENKYYDIRESIGSK